MHIREIPVQKQRLKSKKNHTITLANQYAPTVHNKLYPISSSTAHLERVPGFEESIDLGRLYRRDGCVQIISHRCISVCMHKSFLLIRRDPEYLSLHM